MDLLRLLLKARLQAALCLLLFFVLNSNVSTANRAFRYGCIYARLVPLTYSETGQQMASGYYMIWTTPNYASAHDQGFIRTRIVLRTLNSSYTSNFTSLAVILGGISTNVTFTLSPVFLFGNTTYTVPRTGPVRTALKVMTVYSFGSRLPIPEDYNHFTDFLRLSFGFGFVALQPGGQNVGLGFFRSAKRCPPI